jgi:UTP--glucose-1-phosphate uridylyltransferase
VRRLIGAFEQTGAAAAVAFEEVPEREVSRYGIAAPEGPAIAGQGDDIFRIADLVEKPDVDQAPSRLAISGRYVVGSAIFDALRETQPGKGGEIQLTDALRIMLEEGKTLIGVRFRPDEHRHDIGNFGSYFRSFLHFALRDPDYGDALREAIADELGD